MGRLRLEKVRFADWSAQPSVRDAAGVGAAYVPQFWEAQIVPMAQQGMVWKPLADLFPQIGLEAGKIYNITLGGTMGTAAALGQGTKTPIDTTLRLNPLVGTVAEYGRGVTMEKKLLLLAPTDPLNRFVNAELARNIQVNYDDLLRDSALGGTTNRVNGGTYGQVGAMQIFGTTANGLMTVEAVLRAANQLFLNDTPTFADGRYVCVMHQQQINDLIQETTAVKGFIPRTAYMQSGVDALYRFEAGLIGNARIIRSNRITGTLEQAATGTCMTADAMMLGANALGLVMAQEPQLYFDEDYEKDFKRVPAMAWRDIKDTRLIKDMYVARIHTTASGTLGIIQSGL